jgi:3-oxoacyl-[acyl-carrier protein] reductase
MGLRNRTAVIVNGDVSPARQICQRLAESGAHLVIHHTEGAKKVSYAEELPRQAGQSIAVHQASLRDQAQVKQLFEAAKAVSKTIDILIYVARPKGTNTIRSIEPAQWNEDVEEDLKGLFRCTKEISKTMVAQKSGKIIPVYFGVGVRGEGELASWSAVSGGISGFIKCLAMELIRYKVNVNGVAYGLIEEVDFPFMLKRTIKHYLSVLNIPRAGTADEVAGAVHFLASNDSNYVTGQNLHVNGGLLL